MVSKTVHRGFSSLLLLMVWGSAFACGDLDFDCRNKKGDFNIPVPELPKLPEIPSIPFPSDPECRSDICRAGNGINSEAKRTLDNLVREIGKTPEAMADCLRNVERCAKEVFAAPAASLARLYIEDLNRQAQGKIYSFSPQFVALAAQHYEINLAGVTFADNINTWHGQVLAFCNRIYFTREGNLWTDRNELHLVLHELEHLVQCQKRGENTYLSEYIVKGFADIIKNRSFNIHDIHDYEVAAEAKANRLIDSMWAQVQAQGAPPIAPVQSFPSGYVMQKCSCRGTTNQTTAQEPRCISRSVHMAYCQGSCFDGSAPYRYICN